MAHRSRRCGRTLPNKDGGRYCPRAKRPGCQDRRHGRQHRPPFPQRRRRAGDRYRRHRIHVRRRRARHSITPTSSSTWATPARRSAPTARRFTATAPTSTRPRPIRPAPLSRDLVGIARALPWATRQPIVIAGAGIGGLTAALALASAGFPRHHLRTRQPAERARRRDPVLAQRRPRPRRARA